MKEIEIGTGRLIQEGEDLAILTVGHIGNYVTEVSEKLNVEGFHPAHYDMRFIKPLDDELLHQVFSNFNKVLTVEDGVIQGGFGSACHNELDGNLQHSVLPELMDQLITVLLIWSTCAVCQIW